jgi:hypothetical protein
MPVPTENSIRVENRSNFFSTQSDEPLLNDEQIAECEDSLGLKAVRA